MDVELVSRNMSAGALADKLRAAKRLGKLPKVVIPVHFAGLSCDMAALRALADEYGFALLADASHAVGASYLGLPVGSQWADISVFSFHPVKIITTGEGGMVVTNNAQLAKQLEMLRSHGITRDASQMHSAPEGAWYYEQQALGLNYRMTDIQAALGSSQLGRLNDFHSQRETLADGYPALLKNLGLVLPEVPSGYRSSWHLYAIQVAEDRARIFARLREQGIGVNVHYLPIYLHPYQQNISTVEGIGAGYCPVAETYYNGAISLPLYPALTAEQQQEVADALTQAIAG